MTEKEAIETLKQVIDAGTFYWVMFAIYCLFQVIGWITKD